MKLSFLCANHLQWLSSQPDQAIHCCANACEAGWHLYQQERLEEALPYVGCAFETAEILLTTRAVKQVEALEWFLHTLSGLTQTLKKLGHIEACKTAYQIAIDRLEKELQSDNTMKTPIILQINRLAHELRRLSYGGQINIGRAQQAEPYRWSTAIH